MRKIDPRDMTDAELAELLIAALSPGRPGNPCEGCGGKPVVAKARWNYCAACWRKLPAEIEAAIEAGARAARHGPH